MKYALHFGPDALHIDMEGTFTFMDSHNFHRMLKIIRENDSRARLYLNVKNLQSIDCTGLQLLMMVYDFAKRTHCTLVFAEPTGQVLSQLKEVAQHNSITIAA